MNKKTEEMLRLLKLNYLLDNWDGILEKAEADNVSYSKFLLGILTNEHALKKDKATQNRINASKIPNSFSIDTYPFENQPHLNKKRLLERHDSLDYLENKRNLVFIGPTGTGKTGLASSILRNALTHGHSGRFVEFSSLMEELLQSIADQSGKKIIQKYAKYDCLLIDDLSFVDTNKAEAGLFYNLIQKRHNKSCTIITSPLGFNEWDKIFNNKQLTDGLIGRLTDKGHVVNLKDCKSIREKSDVD